jgi:hypothetical protein
MARWHPLLPPQAEVRASTRRAEEILRPRKSVSPPKRQHYLCLRNGVARETGSRQAARGQSSEAQVKIKHVELLGFNGEVKWSQDEEGLTADLPEQKPSDHAVALKITT